MVYKNGGVEFISNFAKEPFDKVLGKLSMHFIIHEFGKILPAVCDQVPRKKKIKKKIFQKHGMEKKWKKKKKISNNFYLMVHEFSRILIIL